jgi:threonine dehydrogenase-like Zn-dependent dehydrogenase
MRALTYTGPGTLEWRDAPDPVLTSDRAALVRPLAVATCDLDDLIIAGYSPFPAPLAIGHECVAEVVEVGDDCGDLQPGQRVSVPFQISCGDCDACRRGRSASCRSVVPLTTYGFGPDTSWGGFLSDTVLVPWAAHMLVPVPDALRSADVASASDNLSDGWRTVAPLLRDDPGAPVLVVGGAGPGSIGLYAVAVAVALGSEQVVYADSDERRCALAQSLGAEAVLTPWPKRLGPFPITVDANGTQAGLDLALKALAPDGICTSATTYFGEQPRVPMLVMYSRIATLHSGRVHAREAMPEILDLAASGALEPQRVTTRVVAWDDAPDALLERDWVKLVIER